MIVDLVSECESCSREHQCLNHVGQKTNNVCNSFRRRLIINWLCPFHIIGLYLTVLVFFNREADANRSNICILVGDFVSECGSYSTSDYEQMKYKALSSSSNSTWQSGEYFTDEHSEHFRFHGEYSFRNLSIGKLHGETEVSMSQAFQSPQIESRSPVPIYNILEQWQSHCKTTLFKSSDMSIQGTQEMVLTEQSERTEEEESCGDIGGEPLEPNKTEHVHGVSNETERRNEVIVAHLNAEIHALRLELAMAKQEASFSSIARAISSFETADQDPINGGGLVFDGVEDRFHVRLLSDLDLEGRHRPQPKKEKKRETDTDAEEKDKQTEGSLSLSLY